MTELIVFQCHHCETVRKSPCSKVCRLDPETSRTRAATVDGESDEH